MNNIVSFNFNANSYNRDDYRTRLMGTSDCNVFIPFFSLFAHDLLIFESQRDLRILEYSIPGTPQHYNSERQYARMGMHLKSGQQPKRYNYKLRGVDHFICMHRGLLYKDDMILMCLGIKTDYVMNTPIEEISSRPDITQFSLFISNEFDNNPLYKNIRKKIDSMYVEPCRVQGIDIVLTSRINNWLFSNNFVQPKFKSVTDMVKHLQEEVPMTLLTE